MYFPTAVTIFLGSHNQAIPTICVNEKHNFQDTFYHSLLGFIFSHITMPAFFKDGHHWAISANMQIPKLDVENVITSI